MVLLILTCANWQAQARTRPKKRVVDDCWALGDGDAGWPCVNGKSFHRGSWVSSGNVATKVQVSSTVRQAASLLGMPLDTLTVALRHSGHTFRATGAMNLASCGIDVWRILLHGRWGSSAKLSPLTQSPPLEASLGRDLQARTKQS